MTRTGLSQDEQRNRERYRLTAFAVAANIASKALAMVPMMLMVPSVKLTIPYLGAERLGVWTTLVSLSALLALLDPSASAPLSASNVCRYTATQH